MAKNSTRKKMRIYHRYLGFFLAGIMMVYALSGTVLIFRNTDFLKKEITEEQKLKTGMQTEELGQALRIRNFKVSKTEGNMVYFKNGSYDAQTGIAVVSKKELPYVLKKMTDLHKATTDRPLFFLNVFFGASLLFFVLSSFWMFLPKTTVFRKGMIFTAAGLVLALLMIFL